jgi:hypothetical protein
VTAPQATDEVVAPPPTEPARLHRPGRAIVALAELVVAGLAVWGAFWAWPQAFATISEPITEGVVLDSQRVYGNWIAAAVGFGTLAALLVVDAVRQSLLAVRARPRRERKVATAGPAEPDAGVGADANTKVSSDD